MLITLLLSCVITLSACGNEGNDMSQEEKFAELLKRPNEEQIVARYDNMQQMIADKLATAFSLPAWTRDEATAGEALCGHEFINLGSDAGTKSLPILSTAASIPDQWGQAVRIAEYIARDNGFGPPQEIVDRVGQHQLDFKDAWGGRLTMGSQIHTVLSVRTGCHFDLGGEAARDTDSATRVRPLTQSGREHVLQAHGEAWSAARPA
jgi:hypothetical protein